MHHAVKSMSIVKKFAANKCNNDEITTLCIILCIRDDSFHKVYITVGLWNKLTNIHNEQSDKAVTTAHSLSIYKTATFNNSM